MQGRPTMGGLFDFDSPSLFSSMDCPIAMTPRRDPLGPSGEARPAAGNGPLAVGRVSALLTRPKPA
jgi:hypothetical protein